MSAVKGTTFTLYRSDTKQKRDNNLYPKECKIDTPESLHEAVVYDNVPCKFRGGHRAEKNFMQSNVVIMDIDNTHSEDPEDWKTLDDVYEAFPDVEFYHVQSRNYMQIKDRKAPREKYHIYFPLSHAITDVEQYRTLKEHIYNLFPYFDENAKDVPHFFFAVPKEREVDIYDGEQTVDEYIAGLKDELQTKMDAAYDEYHSKYGIGKDKKETAAGNQKKYELPEKIKNGNRNSELLKLQGKLAGMNMYTAAEIEAQIREINRTRCEPPLPEDELDKTIFKSLGEWIDKAAEDHAGTVSKESQANDLIVLNTVDNVDEEEVDWLVYRYIPKGQVTILCGDGGTGKTSIWCDIIASVTTGNKCIFDEGLSVYDTFGDPERTPSEAMFFSSEDSVPKVLKRRLRIAGADLRKVRYLDLKDKDFARIKFGSDELEKLIADHRPAVCVFDPLQTFIPTSITMGSRNAMRQCLSPLISLGERYGTTFIIIVHTNKKQNVSGRDRISDSSDLWDCSRSVLIAGKTGEDNIRYLSHEKCNYGELAETVLYGIEEGRVMYKGTTNKRDRDYVRENAVIERCAPKLDTAKERILDYLKDGEEKPVKDLDEAVKAAGTAEGTLKNAKSELKAEGAISYRVEGYGEHKKFFVKLKKG